ncbi:molybdopterin converting factor, subunit 1 [Terriglobus roseus DSM 18391]|uniref:Molybdopterin synthase sulfur carrier subunit n=1 Tax=Terriglobus roseus (strain DSM 18391 / NRRL B-41598 / KBS 63) TaxID=926566 RepID=I3ZJN0_TERRK|nr:molybdopterin converting factor subunit 1 [Terriglobus roseus]AFL89448.1 molybdopterin converting factor, subunit 1 [Terriglobus roseus DSM 18391]
MQVNVLFFGVLREAIGASETVEVADMTTVADLLTYFEERSREDLAEMWPRIAVAVNREYVGREHVLMEEDEVALLPPVSGGASTRDTYAD